MSIYELKTDPAVFLMSFTGIKNFEIRKNDRDFKVGDILILKETTHSGKDMKGGAPLEYTGRVLVRRVGYVLSGPIYGLDKDWVILDVEKV